MSVVVIGLNHRSAALDLLERTHIGEGNLPKALTDMQGRDSIDETVIVSTCNRTEIYAASEMFHGAADSIKEFLSDFCGVPQDDLAPHLYSFYEMEAASHLFAVTSGLDSAVVGETEIQGQIKQAYEFAQNEKTAGPCLNLLFRHALEAGKKIRSRTNVKENFQSLTEAAITLVGQHIDLKKKKIIVLGAGDMGRQTASSLKKAGIKNICIASRTWQNASALAADLDCEAVHLDELTLQMAVADVMFSLTGSQFLQFERDEIVNIMAARSGRELLIADMAMPRDVDPTAADIENLTLLDINSVQDFARDSSSIVGEELALAQEILAEEATRYEAHCMDEQMSPLITLFRRKICNISQDEFDRFANKLASLEPNEKDTVEELVHSIINKVLHEPTVKLKKSEKELGESLKKLFDL